jgi:polyisoprenyl-phosphate glycosyltransferase
MQKSTIDSSNSQSASGKSLLSIVVPSYNEEAVLQAFHRRISAVLESIAMDVEIIYVNDGSTDNSLKIMRQLREADARIAIIDLSRNFGKEIAMTAGLDHASGDAVVIIDADLQDPPELIPELLKNWVDGYDVVYAKRVSREGEGVVKRFTAKAFYKLIGTISHLEIPADSGDYRLLSRRAVNSLKKLREQHRFMKGIFAWIGYPQKAITFRRDSRFAGKTKWNYWKLWNFALEGITSFSIWPLKIATYLGLFTALMAFIYAGYMIYKTLVYGNPVAGYPSLLVFILFLGGIQLIAIGIIGEYLGRIYDEAKHRPLYLLKGYESSTTDNRSS